MQGVQVAVTDALRHYEGGGAQFKTGDLVLIRVFKRKKFEPRWAGPCVVMEARPTSLQVKTESGGIRVVSASDVKPYKAAAASGGSIVENDVDAAAPEGAAAPSE